MKQQGQVLLEMVVVIFVAVLVIGGIVSLAAIAVRNSNFSRDQAEAIRLAQEANEWIAQKRDESWGTFYTRASGTGSLYCMQTLGFDVGGGCVDSRRINGYFTREVKLTSTNPGTVEVEVWVSWRDSKGVHDSKLKSVLTSWK